MRGRAGASQRSRQVEADDPTIYPEEERVGEEMMQRWIAELLRPLLERWLNRRAVFFVGADQFIYWKKHDPLKRYAPDVYVLPGVPPDSRVKSWKTWLKGLSPSFALEVVSGDWEKDYVESPERAAEAGIGELVVYDPEWAERPGDVGSRWQVFRRAPLHRGDLRPPRTPRSLPRSESAFARSDSLRSSKAGLLRRIEATDEDRVRSRALRCWLREVGVADAARLRIGVGPNGVELVPTAEEEALAAQKAALAAADAERAAKEAERAVADAERIAKEAERAAKEVALARVAELERELAKAGARGTARPRRRRSPRRVG